MSNKTCKNCKYYLADMFHCQKNDVMAEAHNTCEDFEPKIITNGDKIRQGENRALAEFQQQCSCDVCVYFGKGNPFHTFCDKPDDKTCIDGIEAWLNAPAESEGKDE